MVKLYEQVTSYRPMSLLSSIVKLFEKALLHPPNFPIAIRNKHSAIDWIPNDYRKEVLSYYVFGYITDIWLGVA